MNASSIALVGDYQQSVTAHQAIPLALDYAANAMSMEIHYQWIHSQEVNLRSLEQFSGIWCVPASPYTNTENVLLAIHYARVNDRPFLGTCGGYQHAALEFARNALDYPEADNAEINPNCKMPLISGLSCRLYDQSADIFLAKGSRITDIYQSEKITEDYFCGFGVNRDYLGIFDHSDLCFSGFDTDGDPRTLEIPHNRFFIGTAFQPERSALTDCVHPLISAFVTAAAEATESELSEKQ
ncbi:MAG: hypothetical protein AAF402_01580 [Pseudomonadota bacterium]